MMTDSATIEDNGDGTFSVVGDMTYDQTGTYTVTVQISDYYGDWDTAMSTITVEGGATASHGQPTHGTPAHGTPAPVRTPVTPVAAAPTPTPTPPPAVLDATLAQVLGLLSGHHGHTAHHARHGRHH
jgi:hypothetical protein